MNYYAGFEYRKRAVEGTSPVGLVVMLYAAIVTSLLRAQDAIKKNDIERRVSELNHVLQVIGQLQGTLDFERGGEWRCTWTVFTVSCADACWQPAYETLRKSCRNWYSTLLL